MIVLWYSVENENKYETKDEQKITCVSFHIFYYMCVISRCFSKIVKVVPMLPYIAEMLGSGVPR